MNRIIAMLQPFVTTQIIYVYENNLKKDAIQCSERKVVDTIYKACQDYNVEEIEFIGLKQYSKGIGNKILKKELEQYNENKINIIYK